MSGIKIVATDLDGTLLNTDKSVPDGFFDVVRELHRRGVTIVIASGRQYFNCLKLFEPIADCLMFIADNGALVYKDGECIVKRCLEPEWIDDALTTIGGIQHAHPVLCGVKSAYGEPCNDEYAYNVSLYYERRDISNGAIRRARADDIVKIAIFDDGDAANNEYPIIKTRFEASLSVALSGFHWVDLMRPGVDKGAAMRDIQKMLNVKPEECMAFGDYDNDLPMLLACGESYAMANATETIKRACRHNMRWSNDEAGVLRILRSEFSL